MICVALKEVVKWVEYDLYTRRPHVFLPTPFRSKTCRRMKYIHRDGCFMNVTLCRILELILVVILNFGSIILTFKS